MNVWPADKYCVGILTCYPGRANIRVKIPKLIPKNKDPRFLFLTLQHQEALAKCQSVIENRMGASVTYGPIGSGKTTIARRITESYYEGKRKEYRAKQKEIETKMSKLRFADEEYYLTSEYLLKLASNASKLFESSEAHEKRLLLKMTLHNLRLKGNKVQYDWIKPFDKIAFYASRSAWLPTPKLGIQLDFTPIIQVFQNVAYMGELRQRWVEIKKLRG